MPIPERCWSTIQRSWDEALSVATRTRKCPTGLRLWLSRPDWGDRSLIRASMMMAAYDVRRQEQRKNSLATVRMGGAVCNTYDFRLLRPADVFCLAICRHAMIEAKNRRNKHIKGEGAVQSKTYFDLCVKKLSLLAYEVEIRGSLNILDLHVHCENFYARLLNCIYGLALVNMNSIEQNAEGIDLIDHSNKTVLQVSSTASTTKVQKSLEKDLCEYEGYRFRFVSISKDASSLRANVFRNPHKLIFEPKNDIIDIKSLSAAIVILEPSRQHQVYKFLQSELPADNDAIPSESNIAALINIIGSEDLSLGAQNSSTIPFNVEAKIELNGLEVAAEIIEYHKIYHPRIDKIYASFDEAGRNKSTSVLHAFNRFYLQLSRQYKGDDLYFEIIQHVMNAAKNSSNFQPTTLEELELCVNILAVDAFLRCRIFKNPKENKHATV